MEQRLSPGSSFGAYEILGLLGAGGFGAVYKARDTRLNRSVAIKILPSTDAELKGKVIREARAIAALQHPGICTLHDIGSSDGLDFLVLEYLQGETLASRIERGPVQLAEALNIAAQIADALNAAHRAGFVHRDLKPANVMLTKSGAKLLDFGLARETCAPGADQDAQDTIRVLTRPGVVVGTPAYMAPEQLEGGAADARADIFALGCVLYEMLTGRRAFAGVTRAGTPSLISEPGPTQLDAVSRQRLDQVIHACLAFEVDMRMRDAHDVSLELRWIAEVLGSSSSKLPASAWRTATVAVLGAAIVATALVVVWQRNPPSSSGRSVTTLALMAPPDVRLSSFAAPAISPNSAAVAFVVDTGSHPGIYVRTLSTGEVRVLPGTGDALGQFWSPDSKQLAFFGDGKLKKIDVAGGAAITLCDAPAARGGSWSSRGQIVFAPNDTGGLFEVSAAGGIPTPVSKLDESSGETSHRLPFFLPDGTHFLYVAWNTPEQTAVYTGETKGTTRRKVLNAESNAIYVPTGYILFMQGRTLMAQKFSPSEVSVAGDPVPIAHHVDYSSAFGLQGQFSASQNGTLVFSSDNAVRAQLMLVDRAGIVLQKLGTPRVFNNFAPSPDLKSIALVAYDDEGGLADVWIHDVKRGTESRLTTNGRAGQVRWAPDGRRLAYSSARSGRYQIYIEDLSRGPDSSSTPFFVAPQTWHPLDWSRQPETLMAHVWDPKTGADLWLAPISGEGRTPYLQTPADETDARISPDGHWVAYVSNTAGQPQVYINGFPKPGRAQLVWNGSGGLPLWSDDRRELFFQRGDGMLMSVTVSATNSMNIGEPHPMFNVSDSAWIQVAGPNRFFVAKEIGSVTQSLTVVMNSPSVTKTDR